MTLDKLPKSSLPGFLTWKKELITILLHLIDDVSLDVTKIGYMKHSRHSFSLAVVFIAPGLKMRKLRPHHVK